MTDEEIETVLARARRATVGESVVESRFFWICAGLAIVTSPVAGVYSVMASGLFVCIATALGQTSSTAEKEWRAEKALRAWRFIAHQEEYFRSDSPSSERLKQQIEQIYEASPRGRVFPLTQAVRLLNAHLCQQERVQWLADHIFSLHEQKDALTLKLARLRDLGEENEVGRVRLAQLTDNIRALEASMTGIEASCARLEAIVDKVHQAAEIKKLHLEIGQLADDNLARSPELDLEEAEDLERQIGREIETFLQLERETDAHLREL